MTRRFLKAFPFLILAGAGARAEVRIIRNGSWFNAYATVAAASSAAQEGDLIEIDAGLYAGAEGTAVWTDDNLTVRGVGGRPHLRADGADVAGRGIWWLNGATNFTVENVEFSGAEVPDDNGAGIRAQGSGLLVVRNCYFHDNQNGILGGGDSNAELLVEYSEFAWNGAGDGYSHNLYIGNIRRLTFQHNYSHHAHVGHNLKSRARENFILYNRLMDEADGDASYEIDVPDGGLTYVIGNLVQKGPNANNNQFVSYGAESGSNPLELYVVNNTFVNDRGSATYMRVRAGTTGRVLNNLFLGGGNLFNTASPWITLPADHNHQGNRSLLVSAGTYDYHLAADASAAIGQGVAPGTLGGHDAAPVFHYVHPSQREPRVMSGTPDLGAYKAASGVSPVPPARPRRLHWRNP